MGMTPIYNATLEDTEVQCNSTMYSFKAQESTQVPDDLVNFIIGDYGHRGLFALKYGMDIKKARRDALLAYVRGTLDERIKNYIREMDEAKRRGVTIDEAPAFKRAKQWRAEILEMLNVEAPLDKELSYTKDFKPWDDSIFNEAPKVFNTIEELEELHKQKEPKKKVKVSYKDLDIQTQVSV